MEIIKNFGVGFATLAVIFGIMYGIEYTALSFGATEKQAGMFMFAPMIGYLTYVFGGLTRSIYFKKS
jgi:hypothetical protein